MLIHEMRLISLFVKLNARDFSTPDVKFSECTQDNVDPYTYSSTRGRLPNILTQTNEVVHNEISNLMWLKKVFILLKFYTRKM